MYFKKILIYLLICNKLLIKGGATMKKLLVNLLVGCAILLSVGGYQAQVDTSVSEISLNGGVQVFSEKLPDLPSIH